MLETSLQLDKPGIRWFETTFVEIIVPQVIFKIHVEPFTSSLASLTDRNRNHFGSYTLLLSSRRYHYVQNECMNPAVPDYIQESNENLTVVCTNPTEAMLVDLSPPVVIGIRMPERLRVQSVQGLIVELTSP